MPVRRSASAVWTALLAAALLVAGACTAAKQPQAPAVRLVAADFFPAEPGMNWTYDGWGNEFAAYRRTATHRRGQRAQIVHVSGAVVAWVYDIEPDRVTLRAMSGELQEETADYLDAPDELGRVILQEPLAVGAQWRTPTWVRRSDDGPGDLDDRYVWETRRIEGVGETLETPAGTFRNVIRVRVIPDEGVESLEYYAPGVGLIRSEYLYDEPIISALSAFWLGSIPGQPAGPPSP